jgi:regulation of enolase protein 1 (concanavalin A-like superfamily)
MGWAVTFRQAGLVAALAVGIGFTSDVSGQGGKPCGLEMRVLVVSADGKEAGLPAITQTLEYLGTPYTIYIATETPGGLGPELLREGCHANFQAVILATGDVGYFKAGAWTSALTPDEFAALQAFEAEFRVRRATWYAFPSPDLGFNWGTGRDTTASPLTTKLTAAGQAVFPYLTLTRPLVIRHAYGYLAKPLDSATTPLLTDTSGNALVAVRSYPDGRENLSLTFDSNPDLLHAVLLGYGIVDWVTRGTFIGERRVYASPQVDDLFIDNQRWTPSVACGTDPETTTTTVRMTGDDLSAVLNWQRARNLEPATAALRLTLAFNGEGTTGIYRHDTLTSRAAALQSDFLWVNHTFDHELLDSMDYGGTLNEIRLNNDIAAAMGFTVYSPRNLVTPNISGLTNPQALQAAADAGVRYIVSDTSQPGYGNPAPNIGIYNPLQPSILMIPRRPNNLFYNVATPADWLAEYNCIYRGFWQRDLSYDEILDFESHQLLKHLLRGENDPWMFHQANLVAYDGARTLLTDLLDRTLEAYNGYVNLPIVSPTMDELGGAIASRMKRRSAQVSATLQPGRSISVVSDKAVTVPITGVFVEGSEMYGGRPISWIDLSAGAPVSISLSNAAPPAPALPNGWSHQDIGAVGAAGNASYDGVTDTFAVDGAGADVWGSADALHFTYIPLSGDGRIVARVASVQSTAAWVKAGVMIRETLHPGSAHGFMLVSAGKGLAFQRRTITGNQTTSTTGNLAAAPYWVRLDRLGHTVSAYQSADGSSWTLVGSDTIAMGTNVFIGLGVSSHTTSAAARASFDRVTMAAIDPPPPPPPPPADMGEIVLHAAAGAMVSGAWTIEADGSAAGGLLVRHPDAGAAKLATASAAPANYFELTFEAAAGIPYRLWLRGRADRNVWANDSVFVQFSGAVDGSGTARWRIGTTQAAEVNLEDCGGCGLAGWGWQDHGYGANVLGPLVYFATSGPQTIRIQTREDGLAIDQIVFSSSQYLNAAPGSLKNDATILVATGGESATPPPPPPPPPAAELPAPWMHQDVGNVGIAGSASLDEASATFTMKGAGADVWGMADAFHFAYEPLSGDGTIIARVATLQNVHAWVKAGVMIRATTGPSSAHAFMIVSAGKGLAFQRRVTAGGTTASTSGGVWTAPCWIQLERRGDTFTAYSSSDGVAWTLVGSDIIPMTTDVLVGLAVSSHTTSATSTVTFDNVLVR